MPDSVSPAHQSGARRGTSCSSHFADLRCRNLGILARRVAHDVNNSLGTVLIQSHLLRQSLVESALTEPKPESMLDLVDQSVRAQAGLLKRLMMLSAPSDLERSQPAEIAPIVMSACDWARLVVDGSVAFEVDSSTECAGGWVTDLSPHELEHIVLATLLQCRRGGQDALGVLLRSALREAGYAELCIRRHVVSDSEQGLDDLMIWRDRIGHIAEIAGSIGVELVVEEALVPCEVRILIPGIRER